MRSVARHPYPTAASRAACQKTAGQELPVDAHTPATTASAVDPASARRLTSCHSTQSHYTSKSVDMIRGHSIGTSGRTRTPPLCHSLAHRARSRAKSAVPARLQPASCDLTIRSISQARRLGDLPPPHRYLSGACCSPRRASERSLAPTAHRLPVQAMGIMPIPFISFMAHQAVLTEFGGCQGDHGGCRLGVPGLGDAAVRPGVRERAPSAVRSMKIYRSANGAAHCSSYNSACVRCRTMVPVRRRASPPTPVPPQQLRLAFTVRRVEASSSRRRLVD